MLRTLSPLLMILLLSGPAVPAARCRTQNITRQQVMNSSFPLPGLQSGYTMIRFKDGINKENDAGISEMDIGMLDGKPAAVVFVAWSTGGTGVWEVLGLYRLVEGRPRCVGWYDLEDRAQVNSLKIRNNQVLLDWVRHKDTDPASMPSLHTLTRLKSTDFRTPQRG